MLDHDLTYEIKYLKTPPKPRHTQDKKNKGKKEIVLI